MLNLQTADCFRFHPGAATMWNLLQQPRAVPELRDALLHECPAVTPGRCAHEVLKVLGEPIDVERVEFV
jgi:hypothetical protein